MLKAMGGMDMLARSEADAAWTMANAISTAMGGGPTSPDYTTFITNAFISERSAHPFNVGTPTPRTLSFATAYQATDPTKAAKIKVMVTTTTTVGIGSPQDNTYELRIGSTNAVASGTGTQGDVAGMALNVTLISLGLTAAQSEEVLLPIGWYFAVRRLTGTQTVIASAYDQYLA